MGRIGTEGCYSMTLDVDEIGRDRNTMIELPDPHLSDVLPTEVSEMLTRAMIYPKAKADQQLLAADAEDTLGRSGTVVRMPSCDRLTFRAARSGGTQSGVPTGASNTRPSALTGMESASTRVTLPASPASTLRADRSPTTPYACRRPTASATLRAARRPAAVGPEEGVECALQAGVAAGPA